MREFSCSDPSGSFQVTRTSTAVSPEEATMEPGKSTRLELGGSWSRNRTVS